MKTKKSSESVYSVKEIQVTQDGRQYFPVTIIAEGLGNLRDKNYYTAQAIKTAAPVYEGKQAYYDHPSATEDSEQPNRTINKLLGHYEDCKAVQVEGRWELQGKLYTIPGMSRADATEALQHAVEYKKKYPDKDFVGISINGDGEGETLDYEEFIKKYSPPAPCMAKLKQIEGSTINAITRFTDAFSADVVTAPGAGGKINTKEQQRREKMNRFIKGMKSFFSALESGDSKNAEVAVKAMLEAEAEGDKQQEGKDKEDAVAKKMLQVMSEKKKEGESEQEYEARMLAAIKKELGCKKEGENDKDKEADKEKKEGDDKDSDDEKKDDKKDKDPADKKADEKKEGSEGEGAGLAKEVAELKKEMEALKKELGEKKKEADKAKEDAALAQTELKTKKREELIDSKLAKSGHRREITNLWRPVLEACKSEKEMDEKLTKLTEAAALVNAEAFYDGGSVLLEKQAPESGKNDDLFL